MAGEHSVSSASSEEVVCLVVVVVLVESASLGSDAIMEAFLYKSALDPLQHWIIK